MDFVIISNKDIKMCVRALSAFSNIQKEKEVTLSPSPE